MMRASWMKKTRGVEHLLYVNGANLLILTLQLNWPHFSFFCAQRLRGAIVRTVGVSKKRKVETYIFRGVLAGPFTAKHRTDLLFRWESFTTVLSTIFQGIVSRSSRDNPTYFYANVYNLYSEIKKVMNDHEPKKVKDEDPHGELKKK